MADEKVQPKAASIKSRDVKVEESSEPVKLQEPHPDSRGPWVRYDGVATLRIMDSNAWKQAGIKSEKYVEWNYLNEKKVPVSEFTEQELDYLLRRDGRFSKVD